MNAISEDRQNKKNDIGFGEILILNKSSFIEPELNLETNGVRDGCVRREPMFIEFRIHGNLVIMVEPMPDEDRPAMNKIIDEIVDEFVDDGLNLARSSAKISPKTKRLVDGRAGAHRPNALDE